MKKKILSSLTAISVLAISLCGCSSTPASSTVIGKSSDVSQTTQNTTSKEDNQLSDEKDTEKTTEKPSEALQKASIGKFVSSDDLKITLTDVKIYDEIKGEYMSDKPEKNKKYLVLFLEAENLSSEDKDINMFYYDAYEDDKSIESKVLFTEPEGEKMFSGDIASGKKLSGFVAYEVNKDWQKFEFTYKDGVLSNGTKYNFEFTASQIK